MKRLILALLLVSTLCGAEKRIVVGVEALNYYPYFDFSDANRKGFFKELFDRFAAEYGYEVTYKPLPVKRLYTELLITGEIDCKFPDHPFWGGEYKKGQNVLYSDAVASFIDGTMVQAARGSEGVERFRRLGTIAGFTPRSYTALLESGAIERVETRSLEALLKTVQAGRVDGAYVNIAVAWQLLAGKAEQSGALVWNAKLPYDKSHYHLSTLRHPGVIREFDRFLKERHEWVRELKKTYDIPSEE